MLYENKEKIRRYDALQVAITSTAKMIKELHKESLDKYEKFEESTILSAYEKGYADALSFVLDRISKWSDSE